MRSFDSSRLAPGPARRKPNIFLGLALWGSAIGVTGCGEIRYPVANVSATPDFSVSVSPASASLPAGSAGPAYSFTVNPLAGFSGQVAVALQSPPAGFSCVPASCTAVLPSYAASQVLQVTPAAPVAAGSYTLDFVATSGILSHTVAATMTVNTPVVQPPASADFVFTVSPFSSSVAAGSASPPYSFAVTRVNNFSGTVAVTATPPAGFDCLPVSCAVTLVNNQAANALQLQAPSTAAGAYTIPFTATSGALSHTVDATLTVTAAPPQALGICAVPTAPAPPAANARSGFVYTGDPEPSSLLYDAARNRVLVSNLQLNEVDVLSPETLSIVARLPVPQPMGIDLSSDGNTLYIGTRTHYFYRAAADTLCLTDRQYTKGIGPYLTLSPEYPTALADGSVLFAAYDPGSSASQVLLWTPAGGFSVPQGLGEVSYSVRTIVPSGDREHAFLSGDDSGGVFARYDVGAGAFNKTVAFGSQPWVLAVNQDGSRALILEDCCGMVLTDSSFNTLATASGPFLSHTAAEADFSRFYVRNYSSPGINVLDGNLKTIASLPAAEAPVYYSPHGLGPFDAQHRIVSLTAYGVAFQPTSPVGPVMAANASWPAIISSGGPYGGFRPPDPESGLTTTLNGSSFPSAPTAVVLSEGNSSQPAQIKGYTASQDLVSLTVPSFTAGCADAEADFGTGVQAFAPQAFCYSPAVFLVDGDSAPTTGGTTLTLYGLGFGPSPQVSVGGSQSPLVTETFSYSMSGPLAFSVLKVTVPAGQVGDADVMVRTAWATTTLPRAFHYVERQDAVLPAGAMLAQLVLDEPRGRILATDSTHNKLLVYGLSSGALLNSVPTGSKPQGLTLTPDGSKLLLLTAGDDKVSVLDAGSYAPIQQVTLPSAVPGAFSQNLVGPPTTVAAMVGNKAYVATQAGYLQGTAGSPFYHAALFDYDLAANTLTLDPNNPGVADGAFAVASSQDGSTALVGAAVSRGVGTALIQSDAGALALLDPALSADGHSLANYGVFRDGNNLWQNDIAADAIIQPEISTGENYFDGALFNATGSLYFRNGTQHIRVYDGNHGNLVRTLEVPGGLLGSAGTETTPPTRLLAVPASGRQIVAATENGISVFTFAADPLSIGEVQRNGSQVTVQGSGFSASTTVRVDTAPVSATLSGSTELTLTLPSLAAGSHSVTVANTDGSTYTLALAFTTP